MIVSCLCVSSSVSKRGPSNLFVILPLKKVEFRRKKERNASITVISCYLSLSVQIERLHDL